MVEKVQLSKNGPQLSKIVSGVMTWGIWGKDYSPQQMLSLIEQSVDIGITTFDHADIYGHYTTEETFGEALKLQPSLRDKIQLVTKCGIKLVTENRPSHKIKSYDTSAAHIEASVERSLKNLNTDRLELVLVHRPSPLMNATEIAETFQKLIAQGKVQHFGVSNFTPSQINLVNSKIEITTNQIEANLLHLDPFVDGTLDQCQQLGIHPMIWSPLGGSAFFTAQENERVQRISTVAQALVEKHNAQSIDQILLAWLLQHPSGPIPVLGTTRIERLQAAAEAQSIALSREEWFELWSASVGEEVA
ncbi:MAG: aldo/keto reductase [Bacteroidota bacterium]